LLPHKNILKRIRKMNNTIVGVDEAVNTNFRQPKLFLKVS